MHLDVVELRRFYYRTALGRQVQAALRARMAELWPDVAGQTVVGFGFANPLLRPYLEPARRVVSLMPDVQGVMPWPAGGANVAVLCEETDWPMPSGVADRMVVLHGVETSATPNALLDEIWRVLNPGGRVVFIVPNRSGLWARRDATPFGVGRPYSLAQLEAALVQHRFVPGRHLGALYWPPSERRMVRRLARLWEGAARRLSGHLAAGVLLVEAEKRLHAPVDRGLAERVRRPLRVLDGLNEPGAEPA